ncbi:glycoside hydrolase, partial [Anaerostipes caccae]
MQTVKQKSSRFDPTNGSGQLVTDETDKDVPMNIMYADAVFKALPTTWLYMKYSDDDGKTWSDPILLNGMVKAEDSRVLVTGP